jgi:hypothetical protein
VQLDAHKRPAPTTQAEATSPAVVSASAAASAESAGASATAGASRAPAAAATVSEGAAGTAADAAPSARSALPAAVCLREVRRPQSARRPSTSAGFGPRVAGCCESRRLARARRCARAETPSRRTLEMPSQRRPRSGEPWGGCRPPRCFVALASLGKARGKETSIHRLCAALCCRLFSAAAPAVRLCDPAAPPSPWRGEQSAFGVRGVVGLVSIARHHHALALARFAREHSAARALALTCALRPSALTLHAGSVIAAWAIVVARSARATRGADVDAPPPLPPDRREAPRGRRRAHASGRRSRR